MWIDRQDLLYTIRSAGRAPLLSIIAVVALSLGIGLNAGVFTLLNALFLSPPTQNDPSRFVQVYPRYEGWFTGSGKYSSFTTEDYDAGHLVPNQRVGDIHVSHLSREKNEVLGRALESARHADQEHLLRTSASWTADLAQQLTQAPREICFNECVREVSIRKIRPPEGIQAAS